MGAWILNFLLQKRGGHLFERGSYWRIYSMKTITDCLVILIDVTAIHHLTLTKCKTFNVLLL